MQTTAQQAQSAMQTYMVMPMGSHTRNGQTRPRLWFQGSRLKKAGLDVGTPITVQQGKGWLAVRIDRNGKRIVQKKERARKSDTVIDPVIDLDSDILSMFEGMEVVRVVMREGELLIMPLESELKRQKRIARARLKLANKEPLTVGSFFSGGLVLDHAIHTGAEDAGMETRLAFALEARKELLDQAMEVNEVWREDTLYLNAPAQELIMDDRATAHIPTIDVWAGAPPCSGACPSGRAKKKTACAEAHEEVGHMGLYVVTSVAKFQPIAGIIENVPAYGNSATAWMYRHAFRDMGYDVHEREFLGTEWGELEERRRWCMVFVTRGIPFDFESLVPQLYRIRTLAEALEPIAEDDPRWSEMRGLKAKQERDIEAGKGFLMQVFDGSESSIKTLTKGITKNRSTDPKIAHPTNPDLLRIPTVAEHARCKGVPEHLVDGISATLGHELLGQSICYNPFRQVSRHLMEALKAFGESSIDLLNGIKMRRAVG